MCIRDRFNTGAHHSLMNALVNTITIALLAATASTLSLRHIWLPCKNGYQLG